MRGRALVVALDLDALTDETDHNLDAMSAAAARHLRAAADLLETDGLPLLRPTVLYRPAPEDREVGLVSVVQT